VIESLKMLNDNIAESEAGKSSVDQTEHETDSPTIILL
jgi:hypothetical protein